MVASAEGSMTQLQRLIITFKPEETIMHALYRSQDGPNPGTKARRREVTNLTREGLRRTLASLEARVDIVGASGFTTREDVVLCTTDKGDTRLDEHKTVKKGA
jgi:hypothetical protein